MSELVTELRVIDTDSNIFDTDMNYVIPLYQRAYSWEDKQLIQLVEDISDVSEDASGSESLQSKICQCAGDLIRSCGIGSAADADENRIQLFGSRISAGRYRSLFLLGGVYAEAGDEFCAGFDERFDAGRSHGVRL